MPDLITTSTMQFECVNDDKLQLPELNKIEVMYKVGDKIELTKLNFENGEIEKECDLEVVDVKHQLYTSFSIFGDQIVKVFVKKTSAKH